MTDSCRLPNAHHDSEQPLPRAPGDLPPADAAQGPPDRDLPPLGGDVAAGDGGASLKQELNRLRQAQAVAGNRIGRSTGRRRRVILALLAALLLVSLVVVAPVVYHGARAYQKVFVDRIPHETQPLVPAIATFAPLTSEATAPGVLPGAATAVGRGQIKRLSPPRRASTATSAAPTALSTTAPVDVTSPGVAGAREARLVLPARDQSEKLTILLLGVDRREDEPARSDTMILVSVDPVTKRAAMLSIPRDLKVVIPGFGVQKINAAYAFGDARNVPGGGPGLTAQTIEANLGITVDYFAQVDFKGFVKIVDTVGGLTLDVPYPIKDDAYPATGDDYMRVYFSTGWQHMDGTRALQYARTRHDDGDGARSIRQQQVLLALRSRAIQLNLLPKASELLEETGDAVRTDLSPRQALDLAKLGNDLPADAIIQYSLMPALTEDWEPGQPYYLVPDWDAVSRILSEFAGNPIEPPAAALASPNLDVPILIKNGTNNAGLAERVGQVLVDNGFTDVSVTDQLAPDARTAIADSSASLPTAALVAGMIGVGSNTIAELPPTPADTFGIVIELGPDVPDPAQMPAAPADDMTPPASVDLVPSATNVPAAAASLAASPVAVNADATSTANGLVAPPAPRARDAGTTLTPTPAS